MPITQRLCEDSRIVNAFQTYKANPRRAHEVYKEYNVPKNIFIPAIDEVPVFKYLFGNQVSETVYDSYINLISFYNAHKDVLDDMPLGDLYGSFSFHAGNQGADEAIKNQVLPSDRNERWSDLVAEIHGYGITRRQYIDLYRLHLFDLYLADYRPHEIDESVGTLDMFINDIPGALISKQNPFTSNMMYHARRTFNSIIRNMDTKVCYNTPSELLCKIIESLNGYEIIGMQCFNASLYTTTLQETELYNLDDYYYDNMFKQRYVNSAWRHFFVHVLDYRAEYVYDSKNALHIEEIMDMIKIFYKAPDMSYILNLLACNMQSQLNDPPSKVVSDELCTARAHLWRLSASQRSAISPSGCSGQSMFWIVAGALEPECPLLYKMRILITLSQSL